MGTDRVRAELIAVGSELLLFGRSDTNGDWLATKLADLGVRLTRRTVVGDDEEEIAEAISSSRERARLVLVTGGLGPTADDVTREGLARSLGAPLQVDPRIRDAIRALVASRGYRDVGQAESQARVPRGCEAISNPVGSAPGLLHPGPPCWTIVLPGVPGEMKSMFGQVIERLASHLPGRASPRAHLLVCGLGESEVDLAVRDLIGEGARATVTILASRRGVELHVMGKAIDPARAQRDVLEIAEEMAARLGVAVVSREATNETTLASVVGELLRRRGATLAVAESCTGGMLGAAITAVPGASTWFVGGFLVYSDALKRALLGVPGDLLRVHGAVSESVASAMAEGARHRTGATYALAVTGIAGPGGESPGKPVGLVHLALAGPEGSVSRRFVIGGDRAGIRHRAVAAALDLQRRHLLTPTGPAS